MFILIYFILKDNYDASIKQFSFNNNGFTLRSTVNYYKIYNTSKSIVPISIYSTGRIVPASNNSTVICPIFSWFNYDNNVDIYLYLFKTDTNSGCVIGYFTAHVYYVDKI